MLYEGDEINITGCFTDSNIWILKRNTLYRYGTNNIFDIETITIPNEFIKRHNRGQNIRGIGYNVVIASEIVPALLIVNAQEHEMKIISEESTGFVDYSGSFFSCFTEEYCFLFSINADCLYKIGYSGDICKYDLLGGNWGGNYKKHINKLYPYVADTDENKIYLTLQADENSHIIELVLNDRLFVNSDICVHGKIKGIKKRNDELWIKSKSGNRNEIAVYDFSDKKNVRTWDLPKEYSSFSYFSQSGNTVAVLGIDGRNAMIRCNHLCVGTDQRIDGYKLIFENDDRNQVTKYLFYRNDQVFLTDKAFNCHYMRKAYLENNLENYIFMTINQRKFGAYYD